MTDDNRPMTAEHRELCDHICLLDYEHIDRGEPHFYGYRLPSPRVTPEWPPQRPQRQDSLTDQLAELHRVAARLGMFDAADWLWKRMPHA